ncbi:MAG: Ldh family oxidoreductase [Actinomycetota bacterium]
MPLFRPEDVEPFSIEILVASGVPREDAAIIAMHSVASLLSGEQLHGMDLGTSYLPLIEEGILIPGAPLEIVKETPTTLMVDGHFNFGHVVSHRVMERLIDKASTSFVAAASIRNQTHVGCLIDYTSMAAKAGMIAIMMTDGAWGPKLMAPYGGRERRLGINPWSMAMPNEENGYVGFDMTSGAVSLTKIRRGVDEGRPIPEGWIIDADGKPTTDPNDLAAGGSVLPLGGPQAHKGYVLSFMIEAMADVLSGMGFREDLSRPWPIIDGCFMAVFNVEAFRPLADFRRELGEMTEYVASSKPAVEGDRVYYPGERSKLTREKNLRDGVEIPHDVWETLLGIASGLGVERFAPVPIGADSHG